MFRRKSTTGIPFKGFDYDRISIPGIDELSDDQLSELNRLINWKCFIVDKSGRRFGNAASPKKRNTPQQIPDRRIELLNELADLSDKVVLELGCFEGIHTVGLAQYAKSVKACDSRISNVAKTAIRSAFFQVHPTVFTWDLEQTAPVGQDISCDVLYHVGVLYHLADPLNHLEYIVPHVREGIFLDTHYATTDMAQDMYEYTGNNYRCFSYKESGYDDPFSGMLPVSRWLLLEDLIEFLSRCGIKNIDILEKRDERNGPRVLLYALK